MFGNKLGWGISAAIVLVTVGTLVMFEMANSLSLPTAFAKDPENLKEIALPIETSKVVMMEAACDAGDLYLQAIADYESHQAQYEEFTTSPRELADVQGLKGVDLLVKATGCSTMTLLKRDTGKYLTYESDKPQIDALRFLGKAALNAGLLAEQAENYPEATKYYNAAFALGIKFFQERLIYMELLTGLDLIASSPQQLGTLADKNGDTARKGDIDEFRRGFFEYRDNRILPMARVITSIDQGVIEQHVGDVFLLAQQSKEPLWRTEAVLKLGRYKYNAGRSADQRGARRVLRGLMNDADPNIKIAAKAAAELTMEDYHRLH